VFGLHDDLATRLTHPQPPDATAVRVRQIGPRALCSAPVRWPCLPAVAEALTVLSATARLLVIEQEASAPTRWQRRVFHELPVAANRLDVAVGWYSLAARSTDLLPRAAPVPETRPEWNDRQGPARPRPREWAELPTFPPSPGWWVSWP
jgi:hypothetical protein